MVQAGRSAELVNIPWDAQSYRPDGIIRVSDDIEAALVPPTFGLPWPWRSLTEATYGIRRGELYGYGAGVGVGKTTLFKQIALSTMLPHLNADHDGLDLPPDALNPRRIGTLFLEEPPKKTLRTLAGMIVGKRIHIPGVDFDTSEVEAAMRSLEPYLFRYRHFGAKDWDGIKDVIRYMVLGEGIKDVFLDHLTALIATAEDDRKALDEIMADLASLVEQHEFTLHFISHLTTPTGTAHEEGGRVLEKHFTGSRAIARWSHNLFALERNKQEPDEPTTFRVLKERETGDAQGFRFGLGYDRSTGLFQEVALESEGGFKDETRSNDF
jgi:twinkle protein